MLQAGRSRDRFPMRPFVFFNLPNPSSRTMALGLTQPLTEMSTRNFPGGKRRPALKADNLTAICEQTVYKMWARRLTTLWAFTGCYRDSFTVYLFSTMRFFSKYTYDVLGCTYSDSDFSPEGPDFNPNDNMSTNKPTWVGLGVKALR
jgi:hypothetical protein